MFIHCFYYGERERVFIHIIHLIASFCEHYSPMPSDHGSVPAFPCCPLCTLLHSLAWQFSPNDQIPTDRLPVPIWHIPPDFPQAPSPNQRHTHNPFLCNFLSTFTSMLYHLPLCFLLLDFEVSPSH